MPLVSIVKCDEDRIYEGMDKTIDLIDGFENIKGRENISIKPNLCTLKSSDSGTTTDPKIVDALIRKINKITKRKIRIVETNNSKASADETFNYLGYDLISQKNKNVSCINLSKDPKVRVHINGEILSTIQVPESMIFSDYLISVGKLKTHVDYLFTGVLKNQFGFVLFHGRRPQYHGFMPKIIVDLNRFYKPNLSIIDGIIGMEGFGPIDGVPKRVGVIIASKDPVAADAIAAKIIGIEPSKIEYLKYAERKGIGTQKNIEIVGCDIEEVSTPFSFFPKRYYYLSKVSLAIERYSRYLRNFGELVRLTRSGLSTVGFSAIEKRISYSGLLHLASDVIFKLED
ncbi:MAG: DUF362 domain-containing protein [Candidatus Bathyarchaeota archaeon]|nr:DUF362 domain-containing protein [Candidatus Bathyarchaeota archaeon]